MASDDERALQMSRVIPPLFRASTQDDESVAQMVSPGRATIQIKTAVLEPKPGSPLSISMSVNGEDYGSDKIPISAPLIFSANDCLDIGICLGGPVSLDYSDRAPFPFNGQIDTVNIRYTS
jgi:hypothetical protein